MRRLKSMSACASTTLRLGTGVAFAVFLAVGAAGLPDVAGATDTAANCGGAQQATCAAVEAARGRTITVSTLPYYPFCGQRDGGMVGLDVDVMNAIAKNLDLKVDYVVLDAAGQIAGIQSQRHDVTICDIAWTKARSEIGLLPDPLYYVPVMLTQRTGDPKLSTIQDLHGKRIGLINGYSWNKAFSELPGVEVRTFADAPAVLADLAAGRIDIAPTDPLVTDVAIAERPDWKLESHLITPPTQEQLAANGELIRLLPTQAGWMASMDEPELASVLSGEIRRMSESGELAEILRKWNVPDVEAWLTVPGDYIAKQRQGVDRDADWQPSSWPKQ